MGTLLIQLSSFFLFLVLPWLAQAQHYQKDEGLHSFVTRPDLKPPRFRVKVFNDSLVSPGHWFLSPIEVDRAPLPGDGQIGPSIYDGFGELVWSGAPLLDHWNALDFRMSNVAGEQMMTLLIQHYGYGYVVDESYQIERIFDIGDLGVDFNMHEFVFVDNGTRAIVVKDNLTAPLDNSPYIGDDLKEDRCRLVFNEFHELDVETGKPVFTWSSFDHVSLQETTYLVEKGEKRRCTEILGWDYFHLNSVDKDPDGNYLLSARHTDAIYKVSKRDGSIIWRLGGLRSDFEMGNLKFSRQHDARYQGRNKTHTFISLLDNALGQDDQPPTSSSSRALLIALQTDVKPMKATVISSIDHPSGPGTFATRRGNHQILPNGNSFIGWSEQATHSEHTPDGSLIMSASLVSEKLGSYRSYKFPFVGHPKTGPDVYTAAYPTRHKDRITTLVYVSWNGATEVDSWRVFKTTETGDVIKLMASKSKTGFETALAYDGFAAYVIVAAVGTDGLTIETSEVVKTIPPPRGRAKTAAVAEEMLWLQEHQVNQPGKALPSTSSEDVDNNAVLTFALGGICGVLIVWFYESVRRNWHPSVPVFLLQQRVHSEQKKL